MAGLPSITRLLTGRVATFQTLLFARTLPVVFPHWLFIELEITIVRALILQSENPMNTIPNTLRTVQKQNRAQPHGKNWCGCLKRDLPLTKTLLHKAAVTKYISHFFNNKYSLSLYVYTRGMLGCLLGFWPSGGKNRFIETKAVPVKQTLIVP